jgi:hypothetical protein
MTFGWTSTGKHIAVVYEEVDKDPPDAPAGDSL